MSHCQFLHQTNGSSTHPDGEKSRLDLLDLFDERSECMMYLRATAVSCIIRDERPTLVVRPAGSSDDASAVGVKLVEEPGFLGRRGKVTTMKGKGASQQHDLSAGRDRK